MKIIRLLFLFCVIFLVSACNNSTINDQEVENPIVGNWVSDTRGVGYFEFTEDEFKWFESRDNLTDNYFWGTYTVTPGALKNNGEYDYGEEGSEIFTIHMIFIGQRLDGEVSEEETPGAFTIQRLESKDSLFVLNHRTGARFNLERIE